MGAGDQGFGPGIAVNSYVIVHKTNQHSEPWGKGELIPFLHKDRGWTRSDNIKFPCQKLWEALISIPLVLTAIMKFFLVWLTESKNNSTQTHYRHLCHSLNSLFSIYLQPLG